ncbi:MAG: MinD/ParA family protein [Pseudomonadota bacterium]
MLSRQAQSNTASSGQLEQFMDASPVKVIGIASGKGGVGKTNTCINLALDLASADKRVMILDADLGLANVDVLLGLQPTFDLSHVLNKQRTLEEILVPGPAGIQIVPATSGARQMMALTQTQHETLSRNFAALAGEIDYLLVDMAAGISDSVIFMASGCDELLIVACNEPASITDAYALMKVLNRDEGMQRFHILSNRNESSQDGLTMYSKLAVACERFLNVSPRYVGGIPEDPMVRRAVEQQRAVVERYPGSPAASAFRKLGEAVRRWPESEQTQNSPFFQRLLKTEPDAGHNKGEQSH